MENEIKKLLDRYHEEVKEDLNLRKKLIS